MNYFALNIAAFISGLMVPHPEFLGHKVEAREMKIATIVVLLHPSHPRSAMASSGLIAADPSLGWLNNPSFHGFSEMLYEYTSSAANNGSGFEGLGDNTPFWNISTGIALIFGRYLPIVGMWLLRGPLASHSRKRRYAEDRYGDLLADDLRRHRDRGRTCVLPRSGSGPDRRLPDRR